MNQSMEVFAIYKIRVIKEEGNMSHVNQVYDQEVAVKDKASMRNYNSVIRTSCSSVNTQHDLTVKSIMADAGGQGAKRKLAARKLNMYGSINSHSGLGNSQEQLEKMRRHQQLAASLAEISRVGAEAKKKKKDYDTEALSAAGPASLFKLRGKAKGDLNVLTMGE